MSNQARDMKKCPKCQGLGWYITKVKTDDKGRVLDVFTQINCPKEVEG